MTVREKAALSRRHFLQRAAGVAAFAFLRPLAGRAQSQVAAGSPANPSHRFAWKADQFLLDGRPFQIRSGSMHYPRVPRAYWRDRMRRLRALGLNALCTYVFWNLHEPRPGTFDFTGERDVAAYIRAAQEEGLWVLLRPGPYVCSEWDFGGLPAWLLADPALRVRSADPKFLNPASRFLQRLGQELAPLQITHGGPILMVQAENEYGSFGADPKYLDAIVGMIRQAGFDVPLFTSDGPSSQQLVNGTAAGTLPIVNFGADPAGAFAALAAFRKNIPQMCGEYWDGWFDHWGEHHHVTSPEGCDYDVGWMLDRSVSFNLYMAHGGSTFGFFAGANFNGAYQPDTSSYDYDAPIGESGAPNKKFTLLRDAIARHLPSGESLPALPALPPRIAIPRFSLEESAALRAALPKPVASRQPRTMESLGQSYGYILYRATAPAGSGMLAIHDVHDYAVIFQGARRLGSLDRRLGQSTLSVTFTGSDPLDILVANLGRINFGRAMVDDRKGITQSVVFQGQPLDTWQIYPLPLDDVSQFPFSRGIATPAPALFRGHFTLASPGDTFLDMRGRGMGAVWVNGRHLGRYWSIGPQQTLFVPGPWLRAGPNEVIVLDLEDRPARSLAGLTEPVYETPKPPAS